MNGYSTTNDELTARDGDDETLIDALPIRLFYTTLFDGAGSSSEKVGHPTPPLYGSHRVTIETLFNYHVSLSLSLFLVPGLE